MLWIPLLDSNGEVEFSGDMTMRHSLQRESGGTWNEGLQEFGNSWHVIHRRHDACCNMHDVAYIFCWSWLKQFAPVYEGKLHVQRGPFA